MKTDRAGRYKDKLNLISKRARQIEACRLDLVAMMCKDAGIVPKDDYSNIENVEEVSKKPKGS